MKTKDATDLLRLKEATQILQKDPQNAEANLCVDDYILNNCYVEDALSCLAGKAMTQGLYKTAIYFSEQALLAHFTYAKSHKLTKKERAGYNSFVAQTYACLGSLYLKILDISTAKKRILEGLKYAKTTDLLNTYAACFQSDAQEEKYLAMAKENYEKDSSSMYAVHHLSHAYLEVGDYENGFKDYWAREQRDDSRIKEFHIDRSLHWDGSKGKVLLIYGEQGIGDEIMFASCIEDAIRDSKHTIFVANPRLADIFRNSFSPDGISIYGTSCMNKHFWFHHHEVDAVVGVGCLPTFYRKSEKDFPKKIYLKAQDKYIDWVKDNILSRYKDPKPLIGFSWKGGSGNNNVKERYIPLEYFSPLFEQDAHFISLQYNKDSRAELDRLPKKYRDKIFHSQYIMDDYDLTAALVHHLDCIFSSPQSVVHLAGAMGKKIYQLAPKKHMWQMGVYGSDMPWYSNSTNIWQDKVDDWGQVMAAAGNVLEGILNG
ncbi:MAG: hypothetical protein KAS32_09945 [Candidatus Peribacteraceae bacterium]|nr:hypothetical protein [Candidatus Peribacteraceae bacterium]